MISGTLYFGQPWAASCLTRTDRHQVFQVFTPVGELCTYCGDPIAPHDSGLLRVVVARGDDGWPDASLRPIHQECDQFDALQFKHGFGPLWEVA